MKQVTLDGKPFAHQTADVNGVQLHYVQGGSGTLIVLLHGYPESWYAWRKVMPALSDRYTVIAPDMRATAMPRQPNSKVFECKLVRSEEASLNLAFEHRTAPVNNIQLHYLFAAKAIPLCCCMAGRKRPIPGVKSCQN